MAKSSMKVTIDTANAGKIGLESLKAKQKAEVEKPKEGEKL